MNKTLKNYLNIGCGYHYDKNWTNVDFTKTGETVKAHNLLEGIPFEDNSFEVVYHSHVLEHFAKEDGIKLLDECYRVLKPNGIIRIAVPDLEVIAENYLKCLKEGLNDTNNSKTRANYEWMKMEMLDQSVRHNPGGGMAAILFSPEVGNLDFIFSRIGWEGRRIRETYLKNKNQKSKSRANLSIKNRFKKMIQNKIESTWPQKAKAYRIGNFRLSGEVHQWMYDRYSLGNLLRDKGFTNIGVQNAETSSIKKWSSFQLDAIDGVTRKPDSLFMEATKGVKL